MLGILLIEGPDYMERKCPALPGRDKFSPSAGKVFIEITCGKSSRQSGTNLDLFGANFKGVVKFGAMWQKN